MFSTRKLNKSLHGYIRAVIWLCGAFADGTYGVNASKINLTVKNIKLFKKNVDDTGMAPL